MLAQNKQIEDHLVRQWMFEITSVANDTVAILEDYTRANLDATEDGFVDRLKACTCICVKKAKFHSIEIQSLKERVMDVSRKRDTYGITSINDNAGEGPSSRPNNPSSMSIKTLRRTVSYADEDQIFVGFEGVFQTLLVELVKEEPHRTVISIFGIGGLGKTTLARNLYNSPNVVAIFSTRAWICVSQKYNTSNLLQSIIKSIRVYDKETLEMLKQMTERDLEVHVRDLLKDCKYLVVVDDVWNREAWDILKRSLPDSNSGSRVILTTRIKEVSKIVSHKGISHELRVSFPGNGGASHKNGGEVWRPTACHCSSSWDTRS